MGRQTTTIGNSFGSGGNKDDSAEEKFFTDPDIQIDPEWKVIELLRAQIDTITTVVNANDAASGSYAVDFKAQAADSGSFSTRVTTNSAKVGITSAQSTAISANTLKVGTNVDLSTTKNISVKMTVTKTERNVYALVFTMVEGKTTKTATIALS